MADELGLPEPAHWGFWGTVIWGVVIAIIFFIVQIITISAAIALREGGVSESKLEQLFISAGENGYFVSLSTFVTTIVCGGCIVGVIKLKKGSVLREYLCIRPVSLNTLLKWMGLLAVFIVLADLITTLLGRPIVPNFMLAIYATADPMWMLWFALIIAAPLFEEAFFRGFLLKGFESSFMGPVGAIVVTSGLWALIHFQYDAYEITSIFFFGLLLGAARFYTGSLLMPLGMHAVGNLVATIETMILG